MNVADLLERRRFVARTVQALEVVRSQDGQLCLVYCGRVDEENRRFQGAAELSWQRRPPP